MTQATNSSFNRPFKPNLASIINRDIIKRAGVVAVVLGTTLTLTNQFEAIFGSENLRAMPMALNYLTPFFVVAISQVLGIRQATLNSGKATGSFLKTITSHGIPGRALLVGLTFGGLTSAIAGTGALVQFGNLDTIPLVFYAQAFSLPIVFGMLSQAIAYRRVTVRNV